MNDDEELFNLATKHLVFNGEFHETYTKYVLLEKLLLTLDSLHLCNTDSIDSKDADAPIETCNNAYPKLAEKLLLSTYNIGSFNSKDADALIKIYNNEQLDLAKELFSVYGDLCTMSRRPIRKENFNKMIHPNNQSHRKPDVPLLIAFLIVLLTGYFHCENEKWYFVEPLEDFSDYNASTQLYQYLRFCYAVSVIKEKPFEKIDIQSGNDCISQLTVADFPMVCEIISHKLKITSYNRKSTCYESSSEDDCYGTDPQNFLDDLCTPLPWEVPQHTLDDYLIFSENKNTDNHIANALTNLSDGLLLWINAYREEFVNQDLFFHQILFLLTFVSETALDEYMHFTPSHSLTIPETKIMDYYHDIQQVNSIPSIDIFYNFDNTSKQQYTIQSIHQLLSTDIPDWLFFAICHLSNKQLLAAKNLYITLALRKRYHKQKDNDSFPSELLDLLKKDISDIENICKHCNITA